MNWQPVFDAILSLVALVITGLTIKYVVPWVKANTSYKERETFIGIVRDAVLAAEQTTAQKGKGADKFAFVVQYLEKMGMLVGEENDDPVRVQIEAAVKELNLLQSNAP